MAKKPKPHEMRRRGTRVASGAEKSLYAPRPVLPERHLFVTEGTKTEPRYLKSMIDCIAAKVGEGVRQQLVIYGGGDNTLNLLEKAERMINSVGTSSDMTKGFQHVWVIYDKDDFPADHFDKTVTDCEKKSKDYHKKNLSFHAVWSNECFEVWLLYHFMFLTAGVPRSQYGDMLSQYLETPYDKLSPPRFDELDWKEAVKNAKRQMENFPQNVPPSRKNPCTNFYSLVEAFAAYI